MTRTRNLSDLLDSGGDVKSGALDNAFDGAYSSLTGTPTTLSGYGITDAAPAASPTFTGDATFDSSTLHVDSTNNRVGIGTTGPSVSLDVLGAEIKLQNDSAKINMVRPTNSRAGYVQVYNSNGGLRYHAGVNGAGETTAAAHTFTGDASAADTTYMTILGSGNVGIGTTSPTNSTLHVKNSASGSALKVESNTGNNYINFYDGATRTALLGTADGTTNNFYVSNEANTPMLFRTNGVERARLETDGDFHADGDVIAYSTTVSDERLKTNIQGIENAVAKVGQLNGYTFEYTTDGKISAGVIAQEVEQVLPEAVSEKQLPMKTDDDQEYKVVNYDALHGLLIEAIKELTARIEELEAK